MEQLIKEIRFGDQCEGDSNDLLFSGSFELVRCLDQEITVYLYDSFGDGWDGAVMTITDPNGNVVFESDFTDGQEKTHTLFLDGGYHDVEVTSGIHDSEITWIIYRGPKEDDNVVLTGEAPFDGQFDPCISSDIYTPPENDYIAQGFDYNSTDDEFVITDIWLERANQDGMPLHTHRISQYEDEILEIESKSEVQGAINRKGVLSNDNFIFVSWSTSDLQDLQLIEVDKSGSIVKSPNIGDESETSLHGIQPTKDGLIYLMFELETENTGDRHDRVDIYDSNFDLVRSDHYEYTESELPDSYTPPELMAGDDGYFVYGRAEGFSFFVDSSGTMLWEGLDRGSISQSTWDLITGIGTTIERPDNYIRDGYILTIFQKSQANILALVDESTGVVETHVEDPSNTYIIVDGGDAVVTANHTKYNTSDLSQIDDMNGGGAHPVHLMDNIYVTGTTTSSMFRNEVGGGISRELDNNLDTGVMIFEPV